MNETLIKSFFKSKGLTDAGIAGLMGNLYAESGLNPKNLQDTFNKKLGLTDDQYTKRVDNGLYWNFVKDGAGYGLAQWTFHTRKQNLLNYAKKKKTSIGDLQTQLEFLYEELSSNFKPVLEVLTKTTSVSEASNTVLFKFESSANTGAAVQNTRYQYSLSYYTKKEANKTMKYNDNNKPLVCMQTQSDCYKGTRKMEVKGVLWHSTGANNPYLKRYVQPSDNAPDREQMLKLLGKNQYNNDWNHINRSAGMNCWIGKLADETITTVQTMPWDWRPWGCASGAKGSCNDHWIQFEICEDNLNDKNYFEAVYEEACQITAYLCKMFNIDPNGIVEYKGQKIPTIICHKDSNTYGCGNNHTDIYHWFPKYGKSMETVRQDVVNLLKDNNTVNLPKEEKDELFRIRSSWNDSKNQKGAYKLLASAIAACPDGYKVYDSNGIQKYPKEKQQFSLGQTIKLKENAVYVSGRKIPNWVIQSTLYIRKIENDKITISTLKTGAITGVININQILIEEKNNISKKVNYIVKVEQKLNVRKQPDVNSEIVAQIAKPGVFTIIEENNGFGKLKSEIGWIQLNYTKKI